MSANASPTEIDQRETAFLLELHVGDIRSAIGMLNGNAPYCEFATQLRLSAIIVAFLIYIFMCLCSACVPVPPTSASTSYLGACRSRALPPSSSYVNALQPVYFGSAATRPLDDPGERAGEINAATFNSEAYR